MPPLRERRADILELAQATSSSGTPAGRPAPAVGVGGRGAAQTYDWPGNVRELERVIERAITLADADEIQVQAICPPAMGERYSIVQPSMHGSESMRAWGSRYARLVLERCDGNKRQACRVLDISYHTLRPYLRYRPRTSAGRPSAPSAP